MNSHVPTVRAFYSLELAGPSDMAEVIQIDDDAMLLYGEAGLTFELESTHPYALAERARWLRSAELGRLSFAVDGSGVRVGFAALDHFDGAAYLDQLSVRRNSMRRGAGRSLLRHAIAWAKANGDKELWLTTYGHVPWNAPFYRKEGFRLVSEPQCGPGIRRDLEEQRRWLPAPEQRVAMRLTLGA